MKITRKFQQGGPAPEQGAQSQPAPAPEQGAPAGGEGGQDPLMQLAQMAAQAMQSQDCQAAMAVCEGFLMLIQQSQGGAEQAPAQTEPVFKKGGKIVKKKKGC